MTVGKSGNGIIDVITAPIDWAGKVRGNIGAMDNLGKVATNAWKAAKTIGAESNALDNVTGQLSAFNGVISAANIFARGAFWISLIEKKEPVSSKKIAGEVFLTAANVAETTLWLGKAGIVALGPTAPAIELIKTVVILPVSFCNIWSAADEIKKIDAVLRKKEVKLKYWKDLKESLGSEKDEHVQKRIDEIADKIVHKKNKKLKKKAEARAEHKSTVALKHYYGAKITCLRQKLDRWTKIQNDGKIDELCDYKIAVHGEVVKAAEHNKGKVQTKNWLAVVNSVMKLALGILGLVILFAAITTPWLLALVAAAWAATHALGFAKEMYDLMPANKLRDLGAIKTQTLSATI